MSLKAFSQQDPVIKSNFRTIVFWNVDKLYDTNNDPLTKDDDFLPAALKQWNEEKYRKKITDLSETISGIDQGDLPVIIGLAEIENQKVLSDLASSQKLKPGNYGIIHYDNNDPDGLGVALFYRKDQVEILGSKAVPVTTSFDIKSVFKDILYVKCRLKGDNEYNIFVVHWPARTSDDADELKRISVAISLRKEIDNILNLQNRARIIVLGDFNDEPTSKSLAQMLNASNKRKNLNYRDLFNMMYDMHNMTESGSYSENGKLFMFDQIIVSPEVFNKAAGYYLSFGDGNIFHSGEKKPEDSTSGNGIPVPTFSGNRYIGGASSHFPVYIKLKKSGN